MELSNYLAYATELQKQCKQLITITGSRKLMRKINAEIQFLNKLAERDVKSQTPHLRSSNLGHYGALLHAATHLPGVTHILQPFRGPGQAGSLVVDVVAGRGHDWYKVTARKGQALHLAWTDKELLVCHTAWTGFQSILETLGGPEERERARELEKTITVVNDIMSDKAASLNLKGRIKDRSKVIFGTGDALQAVTVTANVGFIRAAESQGISFAVHLHPARALTEKKEATACPL